MRRPVSAKKIALISPGLAARELGDEGNDELLVAETLAQRADLLGGLAVAEVVLGQEARQVVEPLAERSAPATEGIETGGKRWRHRAAQGGSDHGSARLHDRAVTKRFLADRLRPFRTPPVAWQAIALR